ncbi:unnamed protein product, partial [Ectocarpus sp. 12 AP-2014]
PGDTTDPTPGDTPAPTPGPSYVHHPTYDDEFCSDYDDLIGEYPDCGGIFCFVGDSWCDEQNNNAECGYDGGDCCSCDCVD